MQIIPESNNLPTAPSFSLTSLEDAKILITGGAGFIGSHLAETLLGRGSQVTIIDNLSTGCFENIQHLIKQFNARFRFAIDTITNELVLDRLVSECDVVIHLAAAVGVKLIVEHPVHTIRTNVIGTEAVLQAALRYRAKVLIASTSEVYGKGDHLPFAEGDDVLLGPTCRSRWAYAASKMVDEFLGLAYHRECNLPVVVFRLFNTVGPRQTGQYGMVVPRFVQQALRGESITVFGDGGQSRCFLNVHDAVAAIIALAEEPAALGQVFNIGSTEDITILSLAKQVLKLVDNTCDPDKRIIFVPYDQAYAVGFEDMRHRMPDTHRIQQLINWQPRYSLVDTLQQVIEFYQGGN